MNDRRHENALERRVRKLIRMEMEDVRKKKDDILRLHYIYDHRNKIPFRLFWLLVLGMNFSLFFYQLCDRINYYQSEPTTVITHIENTVKTEVFPSFILCSSITSESAKKFSGCSILSDIADKREINDSFVLWEIFDNAEEIEFIFNQNKMNPNISLTKVHRGTGTCNSFDLGDQKDDFFKHFKIRMKEIEKCSWSQFSRTEFLIHDEDIPGVQSPITLQRGKKWHLVFHKLTQLQYVNLKRRPCVDKETHDKCLKNCLIKAYDLFKLPCRYPFQPSSKKLPACLVGSYMDMLIRYWKPRRSGRVNCTCTGKCTDILIYADKLSRGNSLNGTEITFEAPEIEIYIESLAYNEISLACDIGGLLGLYFGWSILSIILLSMEWIQYRGKVKPSMKLKTKDLIKEKAMKIFYEELKRKELEGGIWNILNIWNNWFNSHFFRNLFIVFKGNFYFMLIMFFITLPLLATCIYNHFYLIPVSISLNLITNKYMSSPIMTICMNSDKIIELKSEFSRQKNGSCDFTILDLLEKDFMNTSYTLNELWELSKFPLRWIATKPEEYDIAMNSGYCKRLKYEMKFYMASTTDLIQAKPNTVELTSDCVDVAEKFYLSSSEDPDDILVEGLADFNVMTLITFMKQYKYMNTSRNICYDNVTYINCKENCRRAATEKLRCRLPFMTSHVKNPLCSTIETAYDSYSKYKNSMNKCSCKRKCLQSTYEIATDEVKLRISWKYIKLHQTKNKVIVIEENLSYPFIKLLADIGNVLGITIGISIMSLILYIID